MELETEVREASEVTVAQPELPKQENKEPEIKPETKPERALIKPIMLGKDMSLLPTNNEELKRVIAVVSEGGGFPPYFQTFPEKVAAFNLATSLMGRRWQLALNNIAPIKGKLSVWGELPGALAQKTGEMESKRVYTIDREYNEICTKNKNLNAGAFAGVCVIKRKGGIEQEFTYTLDEAEKAGQYPAKKRDGSLNPDSPWMKHTKVMLMRKAMGMGIKFMFPEALVGCEIAEYNHGVAPDLEDVREVKETAADRINKAYEVDTNL